MGPGTLKRQKCSGLGQKFCPLLLSVANFGHQRPSISRNGPRIWPDQIGSISASVHCPGVYIRNITSCEKPPTATRTAPSTSRTFAIFTHIQQQICALPFAPSPLAVSPKTLTLSRAPTSSYARTARLILALHVPINAKCAMKQRPPNAQPFRMCIFVQKSHPGRE